MTDPKTATGLETDLTASPYERVQDAKKSLDARLGASASPLVGIVLGSGLGPLAQRLSAPTRISYRDIPYMPTPRVEGHKGELLAGHLGTTPVICLSGRAHLYEGHSADSVTFGARLLAALGVSSVIVTNAAGGITKNCAPGTLMLLEDHLNLTGTSPLLGVNDDRWGPRFPDMSVAYDKELRTLTRQVAHDHGIPLTEGVYAGLLGPSYETPAEIRMLENLGANAVGMSTVLETIALRHQGVRVLGLSCITNFAAGKSDQLLSHSEVGNVARAVSEAFCQLVTEVVQRMHGSS